MSENGFRNPMATNTLRANDYKFDVEDVEYLRHREQPLLARLYRPEGKGPFPTMIELHGGVWTDNDRRRGLIHHEWFARSGIAVAALDFRQGRAGYPNSLIDINYGIRWVKAHADLLNSNAGLVGITGSSSGGHLAMLAAMRPHDPRYSTTSSPAEMSAYDATVRCVAMFWPVINPFGRHRNAQRVSKSASPPDWPTRTIN